MKIQNLILLLSFLGLIGCSTLKKPFYYQIENSEGIQGRILGTMHIGVGIHELPKQITNDLLNSNPIVFEADLSNLFESNNNKFSGIVMSDFLSAPEFDEAKKILKVKEKSPEDYRIAIEKNPSAKKKIDEYLKLKEGFDKVQNDPKVNSYKPAQFAQGQTLKSRLPKVYWDYIVKEIGPFYGNNESWLEKLHIESILSLIALKRNEVAEVSRHKYNRLKGKNSLDYNLNQLALENKKATSQLDTTSDFSPQCQAESYLSAINTLLSKNIEQRLEEFDQIEQAYRSGDLNQIMQISQTSSPEYNQCILIDRNRAWIPIMEKQMQETKNKKEKPFFVFGAAHLGGDSGVLEFLQARGYNVHRIEIK